MLLEQSLIRLISTALNYPHVQPTLPPHPVELNLICYTDKNKPQ